MKTIMFFAALCVSLAGSMLAQEDNTIYKVDDSGRPATYRQLSGLSRTPSSVGSGCALAKALAGLHVIATRLSPIPIPAASHRLTAPRLSSSKLRLTSPAGPVEPGTSPACS